MEQDQANLGYPMSGPIAPMPSDMWGMTIIMGCDEAGRPKVMPVCYTPAQAREIARRIIAFYGPEE